MLQGTRCASWITLRFIMLKARLKICSTEMLQFYAETCILQVSLKNVFK